MSTGKCRSATWWKWHINTSNVYQSSVHDQSTRAIVRRRSAGAKRTGATIRYDLTGKQHRDHEPAEDLCSPIAALLDAHTASAQAMSRTSILVHVERPFKPGGVGDQFAGLLGSIALAVATGRRLELAPQSTSYLRLGFNFPFDTDYTGAQSWLSQITPQPDSSLGDPTLPFDHCIDMDSQADNISAVSAATIERRKDRCASRRLICNTPSILSISSLEVLLESCHNDML